MERMIESRDIKHMACVERIKQLEEENKKLRAYADNLDSENDNQAIEIEELKKENKNLKERIDVLYEFIERNDKLVDEVIDDEDLDKLNRYICIDDDLVDKALESED